MAVRVFAAFRGVHEIPRFFLHLLLFVLFVVSVFEWGLANPEEFSNVCKWNFIHCSSLFHVPFSFYRDLNHKMYSSSILTSWMGSKCGTGPPIFT